METAQTIISIGPKPADDDLVEPIISAYHVHRQAIEARPCIRTTTLYGSKDWARKTLLDFVEIKRVLV